MAVLVTAQLALMSVLDDARARRAAEQIADSRFTAQVIDQTVREAVEPVAGPAIATQLAATSSADPRVRSVVESALVTSHRQLVDPDAPELAPAEANSVVDRAIVLSVVDAATQAGFDLAAAGLPADPTAITIGGVPLADVVSAAGVRTVVPEEVPRLGLRSVAETARIVALLAASAFGLLAVFAHPRPGRGLRGLGAAVAGVCAIGLVGLLVGGWVIGLTTDTLFGEMIDAVWSEAVPSMLVLTGAGLLIGIGAWLAGTAVDGFGRSRRQQYAAPRAADPFS
jgi:hypothetical protein